MKLRVLSERSNESSGGCTSGGCDAVGDTLSRLPLDVRKKIEDHPCYNEEAHHHYARMHVAVAPGCNMQCHYCNRKYDCANESRPGVVSELLTPDQAAKKALAVAAKVPRMTVLGIAGPGDPLANPKRTFETLRRVSDKAPDIKLCLSTNGLALPDHVDELSKHNVGHVTITINCVDADVGAKIYPWVVADRRRIEGKEASEILIERQQRGLQMLVDAGILVKVNSVMIPGINDEHLQEVSQVIRSKGAFLHNVIPLIADARHGTYFGLTGQRGPTPSELRALQDACAGDMNVMRHCRQCRADAVGLLGEDRGSEFTMEQVERMEVDYDAAAKKRAKVRARIELGRAARRQQRGRDLDPLDELAGRHGGTPPALIAVASSGGARVNQHFGHATEFLIYEASRDGVRFIGHRKVDPYCSGAAECGEAETALQRTLGALEGCRAVLCSKVGYEPWGMLEEAGIVPNGEHAMEPIEAAVASVYAEMVEAGIVRAELDAAQARA